MKLRQIGPLVPFLIPLFGLGECALNSGCIYVLEGNGEIGFKQTTSWSFYQDTEVDDQGEQTSKSVLSGTGFDWIMGIFTPADQPPGESAGDDDATGPPPEPQPPGP